MLVCRKWREAAHLFIRNAEMYRKVAEMITNEQGKQGKGRERGEKGEGGKKY